MTDGMKWSQVIVCFDPILIFFCFTVIESHIPIVIDSKASVYEESKG